MASKIYGITLYEQRKHYANSFGTKVMRYASIQKDIRLDPPYLTFQKMGLFGWIIIKLTTCLMTC